MTDNLLHRAELLRISLSRADKVLSAGTVVDLIEEIKKLQKELDDLKRQSK